MTSNRLRTPARLTASCFSISRLLFACCLLSLPAACKPKPHHVNLSWNAPVTSPVPVVGYNIYRSAEGDPAYHLLNKSPVKETKYVDYLLENGRTYNYMVKSVDAHGVESFPSNMIRLTIPK